MKRSLGTVRRKIVRNPAAWVGLVAMAVLVAAALTRSGEDPTDLRLDEFQALLSQGEVAEATVAERDGTISGELADGTRYSVDYPRDDVAAMAELLRQAQGVEVEVDHQGDPLWWSLLQTLLPFVLLVGAFLVVMHMMQGSGNRVMQFGRSRAKPVTGDQPRVTFADVAGSDEAVEELQEIKEFLSSPERFQAMGAKIPKGVLLFGPPGTGKTLLARAVAGEAGVPFFSISGSDFVEMFVGVGASRVRDLFQQAKSSAPAIIFVDEIDAVGRHRGAGVGGGHDEREQTLNQLLVEMDGFDATAGVILVAATNRPDILDPALLRPGRFDRQIVVDRPDLEGRKAILAVHSRDKPLADGVDVEVLARRTPGFTGADLANLLNEAALLSARRGFDEVGMPQLEEAIDRVMAGPERRSRIISDDEKRVIAYHEAGHALVGHALPHADPIHKISIIARGRALGWTLALPTEDRYLVSRSALHDRLAMLLGGRSAEELIFSDPTTGASDDIEKATTIARSMVTEYGMSEALGPQRLVHQSDEVFLGRDMGHDTRHSDEVEAAIDREVRRLIDEAHDEAMEILRTYRAVLDRLAAALIASETLDTPEVSAILADVSKRPSRPGSAPRRVRPVT